jgi:hypothetical protein
MNKPTPNAKMLLFAYLDERIEWGELARWAEDLGVPLVEIIDLHETSAPTRRAGLGAVCPSNDRTVQVSDAIAFAYANDTAIWSVKLRPGLYRYWSDYFLPKASRFRVFRPG